MKESMSMRRVEPAGSSSPAADPNSIVTPEAVEVALDVAELGSRVGAGLIDAAILALVVTALTLLAGVAGSIGLLGLAADLPAAVFSALALALVWGYFPFFEEVADGRTPGKRALGLRVIQADGRPAGLGAVLLRNLLRPVDLVVVGPVLMLTTPRRQRLGDLAAGTLVVRQAALPRPAPLAVSYAPDAALPALDTALLGEQEYGLIRSFLERRGQLDPGARAGLAAQLGAMVRARVPGAEAYGWDEPLLEAVAVTVQRRSRGAAPPGA
jgi:uncharacterized RDD family membrane protein YckC